MTSYVALLRAVNVGGTGKLPMTEQRAMCEDYDARSSTPSARSSERRAEGDFSPEA